MIFLQIKVKEKFSSPSFLGWTAAGKPAPFHSLFILRCVYNRRFFLYLESFHRSYNRQLQSTEKTGKN